MVDRVLFKGGDTSILSVSLPGFDVNTATLDKLAFDSRFSHLEVLKKGTVSVTGSASVSFATQSTPPLCHFLISNNGPRDSYDTNSGYGIYFRANVFVDHVEFSTSLLGTGHVCRYVLFRQLNG